MSRPFEIALLCLVPLLLILQGWQTYSIGFLDLGVRDEGLYLYNGFFRFLNPSWGPLYSLYYTLFSALADSPKYLFYLARIALSHFLLPLGIFLFLRSLKQSSTFALLIAALFPLLDLVNTADPGIHLFNFVVWIYILASAIFFKNKPIVLILLFSVLGGLPFIRQDNVLFVLLFFAVLSWHWLSNSRQRIHNSFLFTFLSLIGLIFVYYIFKEIFGGTPFSDQRSLHAFYDHYYWSNKHLFTGIGDISREELVAQYFKNPQTLFELLAANFIQLIPYFQTKIFGFLYGFWQTFGWIGFLALVCLPLFQGLVIQKKFRAADKFKWRLWSVLFLAVFLKGFIISALYVPAGYYFVDLLLLIILFVVFYISHLQKNLPVKWSHWSNIVSLMVLLVFWFSQSMPLRWNLGMSSYIAQNRTYLDHLQSKLNLLPHISSRPAVLGEKVLISYSYFNTAHQTPIHLKDKIQSVGSLAKYSRSFNLPIIVIDDSFREMSLERGLSELVKNFEAEYKLEDFLAYPIGYRNAIMYVDKKWL